MFLKIDILRQKNAFFIEENSEKALAIFWRTAYNKRKSGGRKWPFVPESVTNKRQVGRMLGQYPHNIDAKGRLVFPTKLREELGDSFIVTKGLDNCLFVYSEQAWAELEKKIAALPMSKSRNLQRFFFSGAASCEVDAQGRILIPTHLREYADLKKEVFVLGVSGRAEILNADRWREYSEGVTAEAAAEAMDELGF